MKRIISFAVIALITSVASAGQINAVLSTATSNGGGLDASVIPVEVVTAGTQVTLGLWVTPDATGGLQNGVGVDLSYDPTILGVVGTTIAQPDYGRGATRWDNTYPGTVETDVQVGGAPAPGINMLKNYGSSAVTQFGMDPGFPDTGLPEFDDATGAFLFGTVTFEVLPGATGMSDVGMRMGSSLCTNAELTSTVFGPVAAGTPQAPLGAAVLNGYEFDLGAQIGVPEPSTAILALLGLFGLVPFARKRK